MWRIAVLLQQHELSPVFWVLSFGGILESICVVLIGR